jgi:hypothetical protein
MASMNTGMGIPFVPARSSSGGMGGGYGGRLTGEYISTNGRANGNAVLEGPRGGRFYMNSNGNKSYLPRK